MIRVCSKLMWASRLNDKAIAGKPSAYAPVMS